VGYLSKNFSKSEFRCRCGKCGLDGSAMSSETIAVLELVRSHFSSISPRGKANVKINSGHRCPRHNTAVGGRSSSKHLSAIAADIVVKELCHNGEWREVPAQFVADYIDRMFPDTYGIGRYKTFTHIDTRSEKWRG
jgi:uncharacterized protein YcbK (DUF882 family)